VTAAPIRSGTDRPDDPAEGAAAALAGAALEDGDAVADAAAGAPREPKPAGARGGMFRSLRVRNYRLYASGQLISLTGTWMQRVAQDWLILELTNSGTILGLVTMLQFAPSIVLSPFGGVLADRVEKRKLLMVTQTCISTCAMVLGILVLTHHIHVWHVILLASILGVVTSLDAPGRQSFVVEMVGKDDLQNAVALNAAIFNSGRVLGPSIAGVVIAAVGTGWAFVGNSLFTLAVVTALARMRPAELHPAPRVARAKGQVREGLRYIRSRRAVWVPMTLAAIVGVFGQSLQITSALLARQVFGLGADAYGLLTTATAVGAFTGAILATRRSGPATNRQLLQRAFIFGAFEVVSGLLPSFIATAGALVFVGFFMITFGTSSNSAVQLGIEPTMRGRVMAIYLVCSMGGGALGGPLVGHVAQVFTPRVAVAAGGTVIMLASVLLALYLGSTTESVRSSAASRGSGARGSADKAEA
jgi:MFS family permease